MTSSAHTPTVVLTKRAPSTPCGAVTVPSNAVDDVPSRAEQVFDHGVEAGAVRIMGVDFQNHQPLESMENQVYSNTTSEPANHTPDVAVGLASMPAPITVPAIIIAPPNREGVLVDIVCLSSRNAWLALCRKV